MPMFILCLIFASVIYIVTSFFYLAFAIDYDGLFFPITRGNYRSFTKFGLVCCVIIEVVFLPMFMLYVLLVYIAILVNWLIFKK